MFRAVAFSALFAIALGEFHGSLLTAQEPVVSQRTFPDLLANAKWLSITEEEKRGYVLRVYSNESVEKQKKDYQEYQKRRAEYLKRRDLINTRKTELEAKLGASSRNLAWARQTLKHYDRNQDGIVDAEEQKRMRLGFPIALNRNGNVTLAQMIQAQARATNGNGPAGAFVNRGGGPAPKPREKGGLVDQPEERWAELVDVYRAVDRLDEEYADARGIRRARSFYRVVEVTPDFIRVRRNTTERDISTRAIGEVLRTVVDEE